MLALLPGWLPMTSSDLGRGLPPLSISRGNKFLRSAARAMSIAAFLFTVIAFAYYPRPWGSHWSPEKRLAFAAIELGSIPAMFSLLLCLRAWYLSAGREVPDSHVLTWCVWLNLATLFIAFMLTPAT